MLEFQKLLAADAQQAATIQSQIQAQAGKSAARRWMILQDAATRLFEETSKATVVRARTADKACQAYCDYLLR